jgi:copper chaperone CopZ
MNYELEVTGMTCNHCRMRVERALGGVPEVASVEVDLASGRARVSTNGDADLAARLAEVVVAEGYGVTLAHAAASG